MSLPLPKVVADVGPGGRVVTSMRGINALANDNLENQIAGVKAQYAPLTAQSEAASKLAYANLMGPQFLAKLMGNQDILANLPDAQKAQALKMLYQAGSGQGTGNNSLANMPNAQQPQNNNPLSSWFADKIKGITGGQPQPQGQPQPEQQMGNALGYGQPAPNRMVSTNGLSPRDLENIKRLQPGDSYMPDFGQGDQGAQPGQDTQGASMPSPQGAPPTFSENVANYKGVLKEGEEAGKIRADDIKNLNDAAFNSETSQATLDSITNILASPEFEQIRQVPLLGHHELSYYAKEGTPAQQNLVGQYYTLTGNLIKDASRDFAGQFRKGEQQLLQGMKPNASDTVDTARGKLESLSYLNQMLGTRSKLTSQIMNKYHVNKGQALEMADKQIDGAAIRQNVHEKLNPTVTITNRKTGETKTVSAAEARALGVPNV